MLRRASALIPHIARLRVCLWVCLWVAAHTAPATAHEGQLEHRLLLQLEANATLALLLYEVPAGADASLLRAMFDANHDASLSDDERAALAQKLSRDALAGLSLQRDGVALAVSALDWRLDVDTSRADGGLLLGLKLDLSPFGPGRYTVTQTLPAAPTLTVEADAHPPLSFDAALGLPPADPAAVGPWALRPGDTLSFSVRATPPPPP